MEIKTKYVEKINEEKQGIELYFKEIPTKEEREQLKANGYRWHKAKKCWYIKQSKTQQPIELGSKEIENSCSGYGWKGVNSDKHLSIVEIAKIIKKELKRVFPSATFSVTTEGNCYYNGLNISLMKDTKNPFNDYETAIKEASKSPKTKIIENYDNWVRRWEELVQLFDEYEHNGLRYSRRVAAIARVNAAKARAKRAQFIAEQHETVENYDILMQCWNEVAELAEIVINEHTPKGFLQYEVVEAARREAELAMDKRDFAAMIRQSTFLSITALLGKK